MISTPDLREHVKGCPLCKKTYGCEELREVIPAFGRYCYDLIGLIGMLRHVENKQSKEIRATILSRHQLLISRSTINELAHVFLDYLLAVHSARFMQVRRLLSLRGGYVLAIDGTCEAGTEVNFAGIDEQQGLVLWIMRMSTENTRDITTFLHQCVTMYGRPLAILRDLSVQIQGAVEAVLPDIPDLICHYHFLTALGEKLCCSHHRHLTNYITRKLKMRASLNSVRKDLTRYSKGSKTIAEKEIDQVISNPTLVKTGDLDQLKRTLAYSLLKWLIDSNADLKGEYIPFDLPSLAFYRRACKVYDVVDNLLTHNKVQKKKWQVLCTIRTHLSPVRTDPELLTIVKRLEQAVGLFTKLREVLELSHQNNRSITRQQKTQSTNEQVVRCEKKLHHFYKQLQKRVNTSNDEAQREDCFLVLKYLDKYWANLFGHSLQILTHEKQIIVARTNNTIERLFKYIKYGMRRLLGTKKMTRIFGATRPEQLLTANLQIKDYIDYVFDGNIKNLPRYFSIYGHKNIQHRKKRKQIRTGNEIVVTKKCLRDENFLELMKENMKNVVALMKTG